MEMKSRSSEMSETEWIRKMEELDRVLKDMGRIRARYEIMILVYSVRCEFEYTVRDHPEGRIKKEGLGLSSCAVPLTRVRAPNFGMKSRGHPTKFS